MAKMTATPKEPTVRMNGMDMNAAQIEESLTPEIQKLHNANIKYGDRFDNELKPTMDLPTSKAFEEYIKIYNNVKIDMALRDFTLFAMHRVDVMLGINPW